MPKPEFRLLPRPENPSFPDKQDLKTKPKLRVVIFGEGHDECAFVNKILCDLNAPTEEVAIVNLTGNGNLTPKSIARFIPGELHSQIERYFCLFDAETRAFSDVEASAKALAGELGFPATSYKPKSKPQFKLSNGKKFGFYVAPNHKDKGAFDSFILNAIKADARLACVTPFFNCVYAGGNKPTDIKLNKYILRTLICSLTGSGSLGVAIEKGLFDLKGSELKILEKHLQALLK
jgi:hypothetical protein